MQNVNERFKQFSQENGVPLEYVIELRGQLYDRNRVEVDWFTGEYISKYWKDVSRVPVIMNYNKERGRGEVDHKYFVFDKPGLEHMSLPKLNMYVDHNRLGAFTTIYFRSESEMTNFITINEFVPCVNKTGVWASKPFLSKVDKAKPQHFDSIKSKFTPESIIPFSYEDSIKSRNTLEYKELKDHCFSLNESIGVESKTFLSFEGIRHTFGVEMETISGNFNRDEDYELVKDLNIMSVHDGSLRDADGSGPWGAEYVTGVLKGDAGLKHLNKITKVLNKKCTVDSRCSVHVHIGSLKWNSEEIAHAYMLGLLIEDEIFSMMPKSRQDNVYCKKLVPLNPRTLTSVKKAPYKKFVKDVYDKVFKVVTNGFKTGADFNKHSVHPAGRHGGWDRDRDHRYSWLNFTNIIFDQRGGEHSKTIEFRAHSGTLSYRKIHNWIKICMAFVEFVHNHKIRIREAMNGIGDPITLDEIISKIYPKTGSRLIEYVELRKSIFNDTINEGSDYLNETCNIKTIKEIICV